MSLKKIHQIGDRNDMLRRRGIMKAYKSKAIRRIRELAEKKDEDKWGLRHKHDNVFKIAIPNSKKKGKRINLRSVESPGRATSMNSLVMSRSRPGTAQTSKKKKKASFKNIAISPIPNLSRPKTSKHSPKHFSRSRSSVNKSTVTYKDGSTFKIPKRFSKSQKMI